MRTTAMQEAKLKAANYCAYQERTQQEVRNKLFSLGLFGGEVEQVLADLISENFVNEERFASTFARGKFRIKHWGRIKIAHELKRKSISKYCITKALKEIDEEEYTNTILQLAEKKLTEIGDSSLPAKQKAANYLISKGYEADLVWRNIDSAQ